jgi:hypothetical protein
MPRWRKKGSFTRKPLRKPLNSGHWKGKSCRHSKWTTSQPASSRMLKMSSRESQLLGGWGITAPSFSATLKGQRHRVFSVVRWSLVRGWAAVCRFCNAAWMSVK